MREHKYQAWHKHLRYMFQVSAIQFYWFVCEERSVKTWTIDEIELREYTGLKDRTGKEIYEGDIVKGTASPMQVLFLHGSFVLADKDMQRRDTWTDMRIFEDISQSVTIWEIIGNVYENPDLLEQKP